MSPYHRRVVDWLRSVGATEVRIEPGGRHLKIALNWHGAPKRTEISMSSLPWEPKAAAKIRDLRDMLGMIAHEKHVGGRASAADRARTR
jgi:hypothetical protein